MGCDQAGSDCWRIGAGPLAFLLEHHKRELLAAVALLFALQAAVSQRFPAVAHPANVQSLGDLVRSDCGIEATARSELLARELAAEDAVRRHAAAESWRDLGCVRAGLAAAGAPSHDGLLMVAGNSWATGAERSLIRALTFDSSAVGAMDLLAGLILDADPPDDPKHELALMAAAAQSPSAGRNVWRACSVLAVQLHQTAIIDRCARAGLAAGDDSTWNLVLLARVSASTGDTAGSVERFLLGAAAASDSASRQVIDWHLQWFIDPVERHTLDTLSASAMSRWLRNLLTIRDVRDGQPAGARLAEHFNRLAYVETTYPLHVPRIRQSQALAGASEQGSATVFREYNRWQVQFDDRGVIWMRFGKPAAIAIWSAGDPPYAYEMWRYDIDGKSFVMTFGGEDFAGSVGATRLMAGVLNEHMCGIDTYRCIMAMKQDAKFLNPEELRQVKEDDQVQIAFATTHDDNSVRTSKQIGVVAALYRLWHPVTGEPFALVTFMLPEKDLVVVTDSGGRRAKLTLDIQQWDRDAIRERDTLLSLHLAVPDSSIKRPALTGAVTVSSTSGVSAWSVTASQGTVRHGRSFDVQTSGLGNGPVALSDLVPGIAGRDLESAIGGNRIPVHVQGTVLAGDTIAVYHQIRSQDDGVEVRASLSIHHVVNGAVDSTALVQLGYAVDLHAGINELAPELNLSELAPGSYQLAMQLETASGAVIARRSTRIDRVRR